MNRAVQYAICSDLTGDAGALVVSWWDELERRWGLRAARAAIRPHVTFVVGGHPNAAALTTAVSRRAARLRVLDLRVEGTDVFEGEQPVLYLRVVPCDQLGRTHAELVECALESGLKLWPHYGPGVWVPHVTLALQDLPDAHVEEVRRSVESGRTHFPCRLETLSVVRVTLPVHEYVATIPFGGGLSAPEP